MQPIISDISAADSGNAASDPGVSGVEELEPGPSSSKKSKGTFKYASSFLNPLELSIDITEESDALEGSDDETYYPSFNISIGPRDVTGIEDCPCEEAVFPREDDDEEEVDKEEAEIGPSICRGLCPDDFDQLLDSHTALVYLQQLKTLAMKKVDPLCKVKGCGGVLDIGIKHIGSAVYLKWAGQDKNCRELQKWSKDIVNHFWYTCKIANDLDEFMGIWAVYRARSILAALDYNENVNREPIMNRDGTIRLQRTYNKKSGRWSVYPVKERKKYGHVSILLQKVLEKQIADREGFHGRLDLEEDDPRRISKTVQNNSLCQLKA
uniref:Uncharacterized protein n=1 Tax=Magallana gigas TaxID=29159 RepID=A0A8W8NTY8_MAGGI